MTARLGRARRSPRSDAAGERGAGERGAGERGAGIVDFALVLPVFLLLLLIMLEAGWRTAND